MFVTAVCVRFLIQVHRPKTKSVFPTKEWFFKDTINIALINRGNSKLKMVVTRTDLPQSGGTLYDKYTTMRYTDKVKILHDHDSH